MLLTAHALAESYLDYCNTFFSKPSALDLPRLQCNEKSLAIAVVNATKYSPTHNIKNLDKVCTKEESHTLH